MGVQGLVTLLDSHSRIYQDVHLRRRRLVVDGCNLLYSLYFSSGLDQTRGGEYAAFEEQIEKFVTTLRLCDITPYVVLDGGSDTTDKKLETVLLRAESRIREAHQAAVEGRNRQILPQLGKLVFRQTLTRLEVHVAQCYGEADQQIAALASEWQCPVLSNDSDFYIFSLPAGLLPLCHFRWEEVGQSGSHYYIPCKSYNISSLSAFFNIQPQLLPAFAALAGNDYVKLQRTESPIRWAQFDPAGGETPSRLVGLLSWLRRFQEPEDALEAALGLIGDLSSERKAELLRKLTVGMEEYQLPPSSLKRFFIHGTAPPFSTAGDVEALVPDWMRVLLTQARLSGDMLDVLQLRRMSLSVLVDHRDTPSANLTSRPIRQVMYGLLVSRGTVGLVEERDRNGLEIQVTKVQPDFKGNTRGLVLKSLNAAELSTRLQVLLDTLKVSEACLRHLPPQLRLPVAVTCFWLQSALPRPGQTLVKALLLGLSYGDALRRRAAQTAEEDQRSTVLQDKHWKPKLDLDVVHAVNQWQACLKDCIYLNQLLCCPLPEPHIARLYEGTLVHQLVHRMRTTGKVKSFLKSDGSSMRQYRSMLSVVQRHVQEEPAPAQTQKTAASPRQWPLDDLTPSLQQLFLHYDDKEAAAELASIIRTQEDLYSNEMLSVKTRFRTKERSNRCSKPEVARKQESRGWDMLL